MLTQLNQLRDQIHANAVAKGFYEEDKDTLPIALFYIASDQLTL